MSHQYHHQQHSMQQQQQQQQQQQHGGPPRSRGSKESPPIAIENVELLEADHQQQQQRRYFPPPVAPPPQQGGFPYGGPPPPGGGMPPHIYGMPPPPPPPQPYYGSTAGGGGPVYPGAPPPPPVAASYGRRAYSTPLPNVPPSEAGAYPTEYQPLMAQQQQQQQQQQQHGGSFPYGNLASVAAAAMHMESTSSTGALTLDDIEKSFNTVVNQQYSSSHHQRAASTSDIYSIPPPPAPLRQPPPPPLRTGGGQQQQQQHHHRRVGSAGALPPPSPVLGRSSPSGSRNSNRKRADSAGGSHNRARSFSGNYIIPTATASGSLSGRGHRRTLSRQSSTDLSVASIASMVSVVSDISKSAFFGGVTDAGQVQMHYPTERVRIIMQTSLPRGHVFCHPVDPAVYEAYHIAAEEIQQNQWEHVEDQEDDVFLRNAAASGSNQLQQQQQQQLHANNPYKSLACHCRCANCAGCNGRKQLLPTQHFVINVPDDIYRRLLDEVISSQDMPCGLYFCGHHEDVSTPSIWIALTVVMTLFLLMGSVAVVTRS